MKRDNTYAKRGENEAKDGESSPSNNSSSPSLPCNNNCNLTITKKRVSSPVPLFGSINNHNVPPTWTHHTRQISEESTTSATSESSTNRTDSVANSAASSQDDSTSVSVSVGLQDYKSGNWWVESIHQVPLYYPLAASSCFVENEVVATVSSRISNCLVDRSIAAMYSGAVANATTLDGVTFYIRLFRGSGSYATGIVVELQHRTGNPLTFHKTCHVIFEAAKGKPYLGLPDHVKPPPLDKNKMTTVITDREHLILSLEKAYELLEKDRIDANRLGMEMLSIMTNPEQTNAVFVAETVILGRDILGSSIYERIHDLLQYSHHQQMETDDGDEDRCDEVEMTSCITSSTKRTRCPGERDGHARNCAGNNTTRVDGEQSNIDAVIRIAKC
jgi:hypothetical protein